MNVAFRADASPELGAGHISRCLTLAESLKARGASITFVCAAGSLSVVPRLAEVADEVVEIPGSVRAEQGPVEEIWSAAEQESDAESTVAGLSGQKIDLLVVDHYGLDYRWESAVRSLAGRMLVIDDLANRRHDCDILLDQNLYPDSDERYGELVPLGCELLLGPAFALLRPEFTERRALSRVRSGPVQRLLVSFGGVDRANATEIALDAFEASSCHGECGVDVVIGALHPARERIVRRCEDQGYACHVDTSQMAELILQADIAIGAGGASSWERCYLGLPAIVVITAANQRELSEHLNDVGAVWLAGQIEDSISRRITSGLNYFASNNEAITQMSEEALGIMASHVNVAGNLI